METPLQPLPPRVKLADAADRVRLLKSLEAALMREKKSLGAARFADIALPEAEFLLYEFQPVMATLRLVRTHLAEWLTEPFWSGHFARRRLSPRGAALIAAGDWDPLPETLIPLIGAVAAGCPVTLALSSLQQSSMQKIAEILKEVFPPEAVSCSANDFGELLKREFAVIAPGSRAMDIGLAKDCAAHRKHCTVIEALQGVIPAIVDESASLRSAARAIARGKFHAAGQSRYAPDFVLVHHKVKAAFELELRKALRQFYTDNPQRSADYARIAGRMHYETLCTLMNEGNLVTGGECAPDELYIAPTVIEGADRNGALAKEPLHGPLLPIFEYETFYDAMEYIKSRGAVPMVCFFGHSRHKQKRLQESVAMPTLAVNGVPARSLRANYGGVRDLVEAFSWHGAYTYGRDSGVFSPPFRRWKLWFLHLWSW